MCTTTALGEIIREELLIQPGVRRIISRRRGSVVFSAGAPAGEFFYIESGMIKLEHPTSDHNVLLAVLGAGEICGEAALIGEAAHNMTATTLTQSTIVAITPEALQRVCDRRPELWRAILGIILGQTAELQRRFVQLCVSDVRHRILYQLETLAKVTPLAESPAICMSQSELASMVGATRETTSTILNALEREGIVSLGHRQVLLNTQYQATRTASAGDTNF